MRTASSARPNRSICRKAPAWKSSHNRCPHRWRPLGSVSSTTCPPPSRPEILAPLHATTSISHEDDLTRHCRIDRTLEPVGSVARRGNCGLRGSASQPHSPCHNKLHLARMCERSGPAPYRNKVIELRRDLILAG